jgi:hypothetical protein
MTTYAATVFATLFFSGPDVHSFLCLEAHEGVSIGIIGSAREPPKVRV